jgi:ParB-like chromosome segregation protein Spo0J
MTSKLTAQPPSIEEAPMLPNKVKLKKVKMPKMTMEGKIKLSTDPNWYGAEPGDYKATGPVVNIPANKLVGFEPDDKMNQPKSKVNVEKIVAGLKQGDKLPPLLVRQYKNGYQVLDGHHRFWAYKLLGVESIPAQIVPAKDIEEIGKQGVMEGKAATPTDPKRNELIKKAKLAHPNASSDEEALALFINDKEERDISNVEREEQGIEVKVANLEKKFQQLDAKMKAFAQVKARPTPVEEMGGVGVVKGGNDPRYCMATAGDQNDVNGKTLSKELRGFKLAEDRELFLKLRDELTK